MANTQSFLGIEFEHSTDSHAAVNTTSERVKIVHDARPIPISASQVGCPLIGLGRKLFEAEAGFAFEAPRQFGAVQPSEAALQPDERMLDLRFRFLDRDAFSPAMSSNYSQYGCEMQRL